MKFLQSVPSDVIQSYVFQYYKVKMEMVKMKIKKHSQPFHQH